MSNRDYRAGIAQETLTVLERGNYQNARGDTVSIADALTFAKAQSQHYSSERLAELTAAPVAGEAKTTRFEVRNESTLAAARRGIGEGRLDPLCLNFASAKNPGGGFLGGAEAQEENLAKSSGLYPCIVQMNAMYDANRALRTCIYNDDMIYSPKVPVFRDDAYAFLDTPYLASMVTAPAVNRGALARNEPERMQDVAPCMLQRIDKLLALALHHGHQDLILGAWGCGVFGNLPEEMGGWFAAHLLHNPRYRNAFRHVTFAVLDRKDIGTFDAFDQVFRKL
ncbi:TIGR02452 family protein [Massilia pseudoviolaceinigra]|uniref:TIGR02452 family protein n=1 Tax=Massilia pseudoviolaceinigra TaxID=3057165 RepID=UPI0027969237|nr:TIGR02452 family protein [Massilia sp. CCM 9206]MDQ1921114.1 TIGR02452 family protein [Massilia sp. CCM 9206]